MTTVQQIIRAACPLFDVDEADVRGLERTQRMARARFAIAWAARKSTRASLTRIGRAMGDRHHTTVMHALRRAEELRERDPEFRALSNVLASERWTRRVRVCDGCGARAH